MLLRSESNDAPFLNGDESSRRRRSSRRWFVCVTVVLLVCVPSSAVGDRWSDERAEGRRAREELRETALADRAARAGHAQAQIAALFDRIANGGIVIAGDDLWQLLAGLSRLSPDHLGDLPKRLREMNVKAEVSDAAGQQALAATRAAVTDRPWELLRKSVEAGNVALATDFLWEVLYFDPDYQPIRSALGQQKVNPDKVQELATVKITGELVEKMPEIADLHPNRHWFSAFDADRLKEGYWWDTRYGWIDAHYPDRYEKGYVYDLQRTQWAMLDDANAYHARPGRDWQVRTEHLLVMGTARLESLVQVATQLEALYDAIFTAFPSFFSDSRRVDVMRYALGLAEHEPFEVWVYATHAEYVQRANAVGWSGGIFNPSTGKAYFFGGPSQTMYHEFTHQVLHVLTGGNRSPSWLTEGIAVYTQSVTFGLRGASFPGAARDGSWSIDELFKLRRGDDWYRAVETAQRKHGPSPYGPSGSLVTFAMRHADGTLRSDFVDYLRDSYRGRTGSREVWDYLGMSQPQFKEAHARWLGEK